MIGRLAAARAGPGVLEERPRELRALDVHLAQPREVGIRQVEEEGVVLALGVPQRRLRRHADGLALGVGLVLGRAERDAERAARAVLGRDLDRVAEALEVGGAERVGLVSGRRLLEERGLEDLGADRGVGADQRALVALDAQRRLPDRDLGRDVALLPLGRRGRPGAVDREGRDRQPVALAGDDHRRHALDELRAPPRAPRAGGRASAVAAAGTAISERPSRARSTAAKLRFKTSGPFFA